MEKKSQQMVLLFVLLREQTQINGRKLKFRRNNHMKNYTITVNGNVYEVSVEEGISGAAQTVSTPITKAAVPVAPKAVAPVAPVAKAAAPVETREAAPVAPKAAASAGTQGSVKVNAPMPGKILEVKANAGQVVKKGDVLVVLEAMKMENEIVASQDGTVASVNVEVGRSVEAGDILATLN
jgi:biotin carboxyl carrier protein